MSVVSTISTLSLGPVTLNLTFETGGGTERVLRAEWGRVSSPSTLSTDIG